MHPSRFLLGLGLAASTVLSVAPPTQAAAPAPKAYIGLFKDNAVAVFDGQLHAVGVAGPRQIVPADGPE